jgi:hypothetical protein
MVNCIEHGVDLIHNRPLLDDTAGLTKEMDCLFTTGSKPAIVLYTMPVQATALLSLTLS